MPSLPPRDNRVLLTVDALKREIQKGWFVKVLPGERELAQRLRVSRKTLRKALEILESTQVIGPGHRGRRRQILLGQSKQITEHKISVLKGKSVVTMAPHPLNQMGEGERLFQSRLGNYCTRAGLTLMHRHLDVRHMKRPAYRLREFVQQTPADIYLLQHSTPHIQQWFERQKIQSVVLGGSWSGSALPKVDVDQKAIGVHAASVLQRHGHKDVAMLYPKPEKRGLQILAESFQLAAPGIKLRLIGYQETPESATGAITRLLTEATSKPTALVTPTISSMVTAFSTAAGLGLKIPRDLTLLSLTHDEILLHFQPSIAGYHIRMDDYPRAVFKMLSNLLLHPGSSLEKQVLITPDFVAGDSLGRGD